MGECLCEFESRSGHHLDEAKRLATAAERVNVLPLLFVGSAFGFATLANCHTLFGASLPDPTTRPDCSEHRLRNGLPDAELHSQGVPARRSTLDMGPSKYHR